MIHNLLMGKKVVLASASPRRKEIFKMIGINALQKPANIDETSNIGTPRKLVKELSTKKAESIMEEMDHDCIIVAADTIVYHESEILNKPVDRAQAFEFLKRLSGKTHSVYTGVCVVYNNVIKTSFAKTKVTFYQLSDTIIEQYINTNEPMDKAGAYGIQGYGSQFVKKLSGCYFNVMGFPVSLFYELVREILE